MKRKIKMKRIALAIAMLLTVSVFATESFNVYPSHWWVGMQNKNLQLMIHSKGVAEFTSCAIATPGIKVIKVSRLESPNYLFIDLLIDKTAKPGAYKLKLKNAKGEEFAFDYTFKQKETGNGVSWAKGVSSSDFVYLIMPDRFSNGDPSNDIIKGYRDTLCDRTDKFSRHGGDFKGIQNHLDYLKQLGVTSLWLTPVIENDMPRMWEWGHGVAGYHGYWFTDHYSIDKRFGGDSGYKEFCQTLHKNGFKVIQDAVYNHVGNHHWFALDQPSKDWFNTSQGTSSPNHREEVFFDPHASAYEKQEMLDGWFVPHLPDLNQRNPYVSTFLIQHAIYTTEEFGIDAWRVDTYKYCEEKFLNDINTALYTEFPKITIYGESSVNTVVGNAYFTKNNLVAPFEHNANGVLDFQTSFSMVGALTEPYSWTSGVSKLYMTMAQDVLYKNPMNNCIFLDNHDLDRIYSIVDEDWSKFKTGLNWLFTLRGIPQLYYGTEVLMKNKKVNTDATVREDFPGGFQGDINSINRFNSEGRTSDQQKTFNYVSALANFRKNSSAICTGKMMQFIPKSGVYTYFRYDDKQTVMVISNTSDKSVTPDWKVYAERTKGFSKLKEVVSGKLVSIAGLNLAPGESSVFELVK
jgi:glycosidase